MTSPGPKSLLVVDDEPQILRVLRPTLSAAGYAVTTAANGAEALEQLKADGFDAVILDLGLPDIDGKEVIKQARHNSEVPILVLSARGREQDKIEALDAGANDFIDKPFASGELLARVRVALRFARAKGPKAASFKTREIEVDFTRRRAVIEDVEIRLSQREHDFLSLLARHAGGVVTHKQIISAVWGRDALADAQFVRVLAGQLRQKIEEDPSRPRLVLTEPGLGYRLKVDPEA
jgi:two-component system KDP operon response regulator KdpE